MQGTLIDVTKPGTSKGVVNAFRERIGTKAAHVERHRAGAERAWKVKLPLMLLWMTTDKSDNTLRSEEPVPQFEPMAIHINRLRRFDADPLPKWKQQIRTRATGDIWRRKCANNKESRSAPDGVAWHEDGRSATCPDEGVTTTNPPPGEIHMAAVLSRDATRDAVGSTDTRPSRPETRRRNRRRSVNNRRIRKTPSVYERTKTEQSRVTTYCDYDPADSVDMDPTRWRNPVATLSVR